MAAYFLCLTAGGGVPLFYRNKGNLKPLPFPVIGSLNGVHMFASTHSTELLSATTDTAKVIWKVYHNSLTLLLVSEDDNASDAHLTQLLDLIFQSMVLLYGLEDLTNIKNIERFKREIRVCYKIIDCLLEQAACYTFGPLVQAVDVVAAPENAILQTFLDALVEAACSPYGCLLVRGRVAAATPRWWALSPAELGLLPLLLHSLPAATSRDVPVFLPHCSPKVPHRLLTFQLLPGVEVCTLCGPTPTLAQLEREVIRFWRASLESLRSLVRPKHRTFPAHISLDHNLLGFILINRDTHKCLSTVQPFDDDNRRQGLLEATPAFLTLSMWAMPPILESTEDVRPAPPEPARQVPPPSPPAPDLPARRARSTANLLPPPERRRVLAAFYKTVVGGLWPLPKPATTDQQGSDEEAAPSRLTHPADDTYMCADTHKCYALRKGPHQLFVLYHSAIPTYAMRSTTSKILLALTQDKNVEL